MPPERCKIAPVCQFAAGIDAAGNLPLNSEGKVIWRCQKCIDSGRRRNPREYLTSGETSSFAKHLIKVHSIQIASLKQVAQIFQQVLFRPKQRLSNADIGLNGQALRTPFLAWIIADNLLRSVAK